MADVRKYIYDGKEYDFDAYKKAALDGYDSYINLYNISGTRKEKIRQAMTLLLERMTEDSNSNASLSGINFSDLFAKERGLFGKDREDSKHYRNATSYLLHMFNLSSPYEEPKPEEKSKTKLNLGTLGNDLKGFIGSIEGLTDDYKKLAIREGYNRVLSKYKWDLPDLYDIEEGYDLATLKDYLEKGLGSLDTDDKYADDNYYLSRFGITDLLNPTLDGDKLKADLEAAGVNIDHYNKILQLVSLTKQLRDNGLDDNYISFLFLPLIESLNSSSRVKTVTDPEDPKIPEILSREGADYFKNKVLPSFNNAIRSNNWDEWNKSGYEDILLKILEAQISGKSGDLVNKYGYGLPALTQRIYSPDNSTFYLLGRNGSMAYGYHNGKLKGYDISMLASELVEQLAKQLEEKDKGWNSNSIYYNIKGGHLKLLRSYGNR